MQEAGRIGWRLLVAFIGAKAIAACASPVMFWFLCWSPRWYCEHEPDGSHFAALPSEVQRIVYFFFNFEYVNSLLAVFLPVAGLMILLRKKLAQLSRLVRATFVLLLGTIGGTVVSVVTRGYTSNWERFGPDFYILTPDIVSGVGASILIWWAVKPDTRSNNAMQRSALVVTPLATRASGAPTARRR